MQLRFPSVTHVTDRLRSFFFLPGLIIATVALITVSLCVDSVQAQSTNLTLRLNFPDNVQTFDLLPPTQPDTLAYIRMKAIQYAWEAGYFEAHVDSVALNSLSAHVWFRNTSRYKWASSPWIILADTAVVMSSACEAVSGSSFSYRHIETCGTSIADQFASQGYLVSDIQFDSLLVDTLSKSVQARLVIDTKAIARLSAVEFVGANKSGSDWLMRVSGLDAGQIISPDLLSEGRRNLLQTRLFNSIDEPTLYQNQGDWVVRYTVDERPPALIDLLLGYVPDNNGKAALAGSGLLKLRNIGRDGLDLNLAFDRLQPRVGKLDAGIEMNYFYGLPIGASIDLNLTQQDTLWQSRSVDVSGWWYVSPQLRLITGVRRDVSVAGAFVQPNISDVSGWYGLLGFQFDSSDNFFSPTRGLFAHIQAETGRQFLTTNGDDGSMKSSQNRQRLSASVQPFFPIADRHVITPRAKAALLLADSPQRNDLWTVGGARSFRGYRENQFFVQHHLWGDVEYRLLLDSFSYLFAFAGVGQLWQPSSEAAQSMVTSDIRSFGMGLAYRTNLGMLQFSYAISPDDPFSNGKVHLGIISDF